MGSWPYVNSSKSEQKLQFMAICELQCNVFLELKNLCIIFQRRVTHYNYIVLNYSIFLFYDILFVFFVLFLYYVV